MGDNMGKPHSTPESEDYFFWLLERVKPWPGGYVAVLEAYIDASERTSRKYCVSVIAFGSDRARKALGAWKRLWGDTCCHMTDLNAARGVFKGWDESGKSKEMIEASVPIILGADPFIVAVSVDLDEFERLAPKEADPGSMALLGGFRTPYAHCCHAAMAALRMLTGPTDIAYFFESGDKGQGESQGFMGHLKGHASTAKRLYGLRSHSVVSKEDCRIFEMTDVFAWEWAKHVERQHGGGETRMRGSLRALLGDELRKDGEMNLISPRLRAWHMTGERMERYFQRAEECEFFSDNPSPRALELLKHYAEMDRKMDQFF